MKSRMLGTQGLVRTLQVTLTAWEEIAAGCAVSQSLISSSLLWVMQNHKRKRS